MNRPGGSGGPAAASPAAGPGGGRASPGAAASNGAGHGSRCRFGQPGGMTVLGFHGLDLGLVRQARFAGVDLGRQAGHQGRCRFGEPAGRTGPA